MQLVYFVLFKGSSTASQPKSGIFYLDGAFVPLEGDVWTSGKAGLAVHMEVDVCAEVDVWEAGGTGLGSADFEPATGNPRAACSIPGSVISRYCTTAEMEVSR